VKKVNSMKPRPRPDFYPLPDGALKTAGILARDLAPRPFRPAASTTWRSRLGIWSQQSTEAAHYWTLVLHRLVCIMGRPLPPIATCTARRFFIEEQPSVVRVPSRSAHAFSEQDILSA